jgi:hypothetical protein
MILVDANLLIYAHVSSFDSMHRQSLARCTVKMVVESLPKSPRVLRIVTSRFRRQPAALGGRCRRLRTDAIWIPQPTERHLTAGKPRECGGAGKPVPDAHLAALIDSLLLCTTDGDFGRFAGPALAKSADRPGSKIAHFHATALITGIAAGTAPIRRLLLDKGYVVRHSADSLFNTDRIDPSLRGSASATAASCSTTAISPSSSLVT